MKLFQYYIILILVNCAITCHAFKGIEDNSKHLIGSHSRTGIHAQGDNNKLIKDSSLRDNLIKQSNEVNNNQINKVLIMKGNNNNNKLITDFLLLLLFICSLIHFIKIQNEYQLIMKYYESQLLLASQQCSQQIESIQLLLKDKENYLNKQNGQNLYTTFSKKEKYFINIYDLEEYIITQRIIRFEDTVQVSQQHTTKLVLSLSRLESFFRFLLSKLCIKKSISLIQSNQKNKETENEQLANKNEIINFNLIPNTYENIITHIENGLIKLLNKDSQLKFNKIKHYAIKKVYQNEEIKIVIYMCSEKLRNEFNNNIQEYKYSLQIEQLIIQLMESGLKVRNLKLGEDFIINKGNQIILNPCLAIKHDPEISISYYIYIYKQICSQLKQQPNNLFVQKITNTINSKKCMQ